MDSYESSDADSDNEKAYSPRSDADSNNAGSNQSDGEAGSNRSEAGMAHSDVDDRSSAGNQSDAAQSDRSDVENNASDHEDNHSVQSIQSIDDGNRSEGEPMEERDGVPSSDANESEEEEEEEQERSPAQHSDEKSLHSDDQSDQEKDRDGSDHGDSDDDQSKGRQSAAADSDDDQSKGRQSAAADSDDDQSKGRQSVAPDSDDDKSEKSDNDNDEGGAVSAASEIEEHSDKSVRSDRHSDVELADKKSDDSDHDFDSDNKLMRMKKRKRIESDDEGSHPGTSDHGGSDNEEITKRKRILSLTSDEDHDVEKSKADADDLFGDADDISDESDAENKRRRDNDNNDDNDFDDDNEKAKQNEISDEDGIDGETREKGEDNEEGKTSHSPLLDGEEGEEAAPEEIPETRIDVEIPKITADLGKELHFVKLPNFLSVETRPFDHQTYEDEIDEDEVLDEEGRARLKLKVENTIRWRWGFDADGNPVKESNARIVRWSDGSMSLHLGAEIFDIHKQLLQRDHNHLFIRQGTGLQGQAVFRTKLTFRPHSTDSFTHRKITISVADRSQKIQKIRVLPNVGKDPEAHRSEMIKKEEDRLKASIRRESKQRRMRERAQSRGLSSSYLEPDRYDDDDDDDEGAISLAAIKNKFKKGNVKDTRPSIYSSDSDASDIESHRSRRLEKAKALADSEEEEEVHSEDSAPKKKVARIEDSEEEEEEDDDEED